MNERGCKKASVEPRGVSLRANVAEDVLGRVAFTAPQGDDDAVEEGADVEVAGPFESYCETVFSETASYDEKCDALREAIMTLIDEMGAGGGGPPVPPGILGDL